MSRITVTGLINVFRESSLRETLSATLKVNGKKYYYPRCPEAWAELTYYNPDRDDVTNLYEAIVTINEKDGGNPRSTKLIKYIPL